MRSIHSGRLLKLGAIMALILGITVAGLAGNRGNRAFAQDVQHQTYMVQAGGFGPGNIELVAFAPNSLKVHRGDTVMWHFNSFHNVHLGEDTPPDLVIAPQVDGKPLPQINPKVVFPTIKSGDTYSGGDVNTGLPVDPSAPLTFSMVIDLPPGNYIYYCDVHPGMAGNIEVVADDVAIPGPSEVSASAADEVSKQINAAAATIEPLDLKGPAMSESGKLAIAAGTSDFGRVSIQGFSAPLAIVHVGDSVTWTIPADSPEPHTITSANYGGEEFVPMPQNNAPPIIALGEVFVPGQNTSIGANDKFNRGFLTPGQSFTVTFTEPGVHPYVCRLHDGMYGVVVVQPAA